MNEPIHLTRQISLNPVRNAPHASTRNLRRARTSDSRLSGLPPVSQLRFVGHAAADDTPERLAANNEMEAQGFVSFRQLAPILRQTFHDIWPDDLS